MSYTFTKLFSGLTESTVWVEPYPTRILWVSMLSWADQYGRIHGSVPGIARRAGINMDECEAALMSFMSQDRHSRTPDNDGRRIEKIDGGWRLLNYTKYREMRDAESRREQNREAQRRHREALKLSAKQVSIPADGAYNQPGSAQAEAEAEAEDSKAKATQGGETPPPDPVWGDGVELLVRAGQPRDAAKRLVGKWVSTYETTDVMEAIAIAETDAKGDPVAYVWGVLKKRTPKPKMTEQQKVVLAKVRERFPDARLMPDGFIVQPGVGRRWRSETGEQVVTI